MGRIEKTVFISYRRANLPWALNIYQDLTYHGFDVFFDYQSIDSGAFETAIIENIKARAHFLVILTPTTLDRCNEHGDWLRREIETAINEKRNIIPIMLEGFDFGSPQVINSLNGKLRTLKNYNGLRLYSEYFFEGMDRLRGRYLNIALSDVPLLPLSDDVKEITKSQKDFANKAKPVEKSQLSKRETKKVFIEQELMRIPIVGRIFASETPPVPSKDFNYYDADSSIEIATSLLPRPEKNKQLFALELQDNSMTDAMVNDGDFVILKPVKNNAEVQNGEMVVIWLPSLETTTLKYFYNEKDSYRLKPANPTMAPIIVSKDEPLEIKGIVVMMIRKVDTI